VSPCKIITTSLLIILGLTGFAAAQNSDSPREVQDSAENQHVIVSWTHFGEQAAPAPSGDAQSLLQVPNSELSGEQPKEAGPGTEATSAGPQPAEQNAQLATGAPGAQIYEADISKKHPHGPELVPLPPADQSYQVANAQPPLDGQSYQVPNSQLPNSESATPPSSAEPAAAAQSGGENAAASPLQKQSPEERIASLAESYQDRVTERNGEINQLATVAAKDPENQGLALIQKTRLQLEGAQDLMTTSQQLSQAYASLATDLTVRAGKVQALADSREQTARAAAAELSKVNELEPRRETALRNLSLLPLSQQNDQTIQSLGAELAQDESGQKLAKAEAQQARIEMQDLQAQAGKLQEAAAEAQRESAAFTRSAQDARETENRLADRLEFYAARERAADALASASKVLGSSTLLNSAPGSASGTPAESLRACIRRNQNTDACLTTAGNP
jgi:hypothetical protein